MTDTAMPDTATSNESLEISLTDPRMVRAIELVWREAALLDAKDYHAWRRLYDDQGSYIIPIDRDAECFDDILNMVYDDARMRELRVTRMTEGYAIAAVDAAITVRTVSRFVPIAVSAASVELRAAQIIVAYKRGHHDLWAGDVDYTLRLGAASAQDKIIRKVVRLIDAADAVPAAGFLL